MVYSLRNELRPTPSSPSSSSAGGLLCDAGPINPAKTSPAVTTNCGGPNPASETHRSLAVALNNAATLHHRLGHFEDALRMYQECVQERMEALQWGSMSASQEQHRSFSSGLRTEAADASLCVVQREEEVLRRMAEEVPEAACLDMYPRPGSRHDEIEGAFLPHSAPLKILPRALASRTPDLAMALPVDGAPLTSAASPTTAASADDLRESSVTLYNMGLTHLRSRSVTMACQLFEMSLSVGACASSPAFAAGTLNAAAQAQMGRGLLHEAADSLSEALRLWREAVSSPPVTGKDLELGISDTLSLMARVHLAVGDINRSLELSRQALRLRRAALGDEHVVVAANLYSISVVLREQGRFADATEHCQWFVHHTEVESDPGYRPHLAEALHLLGQLCLDAGEADQAVEVFSRCVEVRVQAHGSSAVPHPALADDLLQLGRVLHDLGRFREAAEKYRSALSIESAIALFEVQKAGEVSLLRPGESEGVATALCSIGQVHQALGEHHLALRCYEDVLRISRALFGDGDEFVASMLSVIGNVHLEMGDTDSAMAEFADAERIMRRIQEARRESGEVAIGRRGNNLALSAVPIVVPNLLQAIGIDFHPHAAAA